MTHIHWKRPGPPPPLAVKKKKHHAFSKLGRDPRTPGIFDTRKIQQHRPPTSHPSGGRSLRTGWREKNKEIKTGWSQSLAVSSFTKKIVQSLFFKTIIPTSSRKIIFDMKLDKARCLKPPFQTLTFGVTPKNPPKPVDIYPCACISTATAGLRGGNMELVGHR